MHPSSAFALGAAPNAQLTLTLLGPVQITAAGQPLDLPYDKLRALLIFLAVESGRGHRREVLADMLWPTQDATAARHNLSQALFNLRRAVGNGSGAHLLITTRDTIRMNPEYRVWVDVTLFQQLAQSAAGDTRSLEQAVALYGGEFLEGAALGDEIAFDEWAGVLREQLRAQACALLQSLTDPQDGVRDGALRCTYARRWVALDPLDEAAHRRLMRALSEHGQRTAALLQFEQCRRMLVAELGIDPEPETIALYEALKQHAPRDPKGVSPPTQPQVPALSTLLVGRDADLAALAARLAAPYCRLITITGPGGVGKTLLAHQAAAEHAADFADGVCWVQLASIRTPDLVLATLVQALRLPPDDARPLDAVVRDGLAARHLLLLLDNCEHLLPDLAAVVANLLDMAPQLTILATSRVALRISYEHRYKLTPLALPEAHQSPDAQLSSPAVALFLERARAVRPGLVVNPTVIGAICRALDGLPLALELAAFRLRLLSPDDLLARLAQRLPLLSGGTRDAPERQQTLAATIEWSYRLLSPAQQALLRRLAVFAGGWTVTAAEAVCADLPEIDQPSISILDGLETLLDASLIIEVESDVGEPRCTMLETIREYAYEQLVAHGELAPAQELHARAVAAFAARAATEISGPNQPIWLQQVDSELDNVQVALSWCCSHAFGVGLRLAADLGLYWLLRGRRREGRNWIERLLQHADQSGNSQLSDEDRAYGLLMSGMISMFLDELDLATIRLEESVRLCERLNDQYNLAWGLNNLGNVALKRGAYAEAERHYQESLRLRRSIGHTAGIASNLNNLAEIARLQGDQTQARLYFDQSLLAYRQVGDQAHAASVLAHIASILIQQHAYAEARQLYEESYAIAVDLGIKPVMRESLTGLGHVARQQRRYAEAREYYRQCIALSLEIHHQGGLTLSLLGLAIMAWEEEEAERAAVLLAATEVINVRNQFVHDPDDQALYEHTLGAVRAALEPDAFDLAWAYGQALALEQAAAYALGRDA